MLVAPVGIEPTLNERLRLGLYRLGYGALVPPTGIEPVTSGLQNHSSAIELERRARRSVGSRLAHGFCCRSQAQVTRLATLQSLPCLPIDALKHFNLHPSRPQLHVWRLR